MSQMNEDIYTEWRGIAESPNPFPALVKHFSYLADSPGFEWLLEAILKTCTKVDIVEDNLVLHFPKGEKLKASLPHPGVPKAFPLSLKKCLSIHERLELQNAQIILGDHGLFCEMLGWFDALVEEESELLAYGSLEKIVSPLSDYSDLWIYHPKEKNTKGEPTLYFISHEEGDITEPQDINVGSLFLKRASETMGIAFDLSLLGNSAPDKEDDQNSWWNNLETAWKEIFAKKFSWDGASTSSLKKIFSERDIYIGSEYPITSLEPLSKFKKLVEFSCESDELIDISGLKSLATLQRLNLRSRKIKDFSPISNLTKLHCLELSNSNIRDLSPIAGLVKLVRLEIENTEVEDLEPIAGMKKLEYLYISNASVTNLSPLIHLKKIHSIDIENLNLQPFNGFSKLPLVSSVKARGSNLSDLSVFDKCELHSFDCSNTPASFEQVLYFIQKHMNLPGELSFHSDYTRTADDFISSLEESDIDKQKWVEPLTELLKSIIVRLTIGSDESDSASVSRLLKKFFQHLSPYVSIERKEEVLADAVISIVNGALDQETEALVSNEISMLTVEQRRLAYNLACLYAKRNQKQDLLRYMKIALSKGTDPENFISDTDFLATQDDVDFKMLIQEAIAVAAKS